MTKYYGYKLTLRDIVSVDSRVAYFISHPSETDQLCSSKDSAVEFWYANREDILLDLQLQGTDVLESELVSFSFDTEGPLEINRVEVE